MSQKNSFTPHILLVDDSQNDSFAFIKTVKDSFPEAHVTHLRLADEAIKQVVEYKKSFDLIVLEYALPGTSGLDACRQMTKTNVAMPILILTGSGSEEIAVDCMKAGAADYAVKDPYGRYLNNLPSLIQNTIDSAATGLKCHFSHHDEEWRFRALLDAVQDMGIQGIDEKGTIKYWSSGSEKIFGFHEDQALGKSIFDLIIPPDLTDYSRKMLEKIMCSKGTPAPEELNLINSEHASVPVLCYHSMIDHLDQPVIYCMQVDLRHRKRVEKELIRSQKMELAGRLAGGIAHEFNNLLTGIMGNGELMLDLIPQCPDIKGLLMEIHRSAERAAVLVQQMLAYSQLQMIAPRVVDLNDLIVDQLPLIRRVLGSNNNVEFVPGEGLEKVKIDPSQFSQLLAYFAIYFHELLLERSSSFLLKTEEAYFESDKVPAPENCSPGKYIRLTLHNNKAHIEDMDLTHIFEPYHSSKGLAEIKGLGLAPAYGIVLQNCGDILAKSDPERGTTFTLYFPICDEHGKGETKLSDALKGNETILVVEDENLVLQMVRRILRRNGYNVMTANGGMEGYRIFKRDPEHIDMLMTDVIMPNMNGKELVERAKAVKPALKTLLMSGYANNVMEKIGLSADSPDFIGKPFSSEELLRRVRTALDS